MQALHYLIHNDFARQALVAGIAIGTICSLLSVIVVLKRMAFIGEGISHAGFGGVGTAVFLGLAGFQQDLVVLAFCMATAAGIGVLSRKRQVEPDSAIGIFLVAAMAWGIFMSDLRRNLMNSAWYIQLVGPPQAAPGMESLLFGSLMAVSPRDVLMAMTLATVIVLVLALMFREIVFYCFDDQGSRVFGVRSGLIHYLILAMLCVTVVLSIRLAGFVLVSALLIIPGATALLLSRRLARVILLAWLAGVLGMVGGVLLSLQVGDVSSGACIVGVLCLEFTLALVTRSIAKRIRKPLAA